MRTVAAKRSDAIKHFIIEDAFGAPSNISFSTVPSMPPQFFYIIHTIPQN